MVERPWSTSHLSCGERLLLRCDRNAGNSFPTTQERPVKIQDSTGEGETSRESLPHPEERCFRLLAREEESFPAWSGKNSRCSRRITRGGALQRKGERNSRVVPPFPESTRYLSPFRETCFPCTASTFKPRIDSHHGGTWDSPVGKPRGKATDPLIHSTGSVTLLLQLGRKAHVHAPTRDKD